MNDAQIFIDEWHDLLTKGLLTVYVVTELLSLKMLQHL
jgi:hypothetical protein